MARPNVLIFMTDHQRGDTVLPASPAKAPNVAKLRKQGVTFSETFCPAPHCCPARATFMTGLYPAQHGVWHNVNVANAITRGLAEGVRTWCEDYADAGYRMWYSGKWHISMTESPVDRGWHVCPGTSGDYSKQRPENRWDAYKTLARQPPPASRGEAQILRPGYPSYTMYGTNDGNRHDVKIVDEAIEAIGRLGTEQTDQPWCVFAGCTGPHDPYYVPQRFLDMYDPDKIDLPPSFHDEMRDKPNFYRRTRDLFDQLTEREHREGIRHYLAYCTFLDDQFGRLLDALDRTGQGENTIVMYVADHGDYMGEHGLWCKGVPCFRGAYHVPLIVRWPKGIARPGRTVDELVSLADVAPTLLEAAGLAVTRPFVGTSLVPFFTDRLPGEWRDALFTQTNGNELYAIQRSVFTKELKFVYNGFDYDELYDLRTDPHEIRNVVDKPEYAADVRRLMRRIWQFSHQTGDTCINPYIMVRFAQYGPAEAFAE
ncbi:MAG: sulfatase-like hydrolase/transferase [Kiritimatiellae bacterium]|nr:sulfatase-like hydrolase/transferase [Kiritimatiellia bacterium]